MEDLLVDVFCGCRHASAQCEPLTMVAVQVFGNGHTVAFAGSQSNSQLDVYKPVMLHNVLTSIELLTDASRSFVIAAPLGSNPIKAHQRASR
jgi:fumarate hydratase, class II